MVDDFYPKFSALLKDRGDPLELMEHVEVRERGELYNLLSPQFKCSPEIQINQFNGGSRYTQCPVMINGELFFFLFFPPVSFRAAVCSQYRLLPCSVEIVFH